MSIVVDHGLRYELFDRNPVQRVHHSCCESPLSETDAHNGMEGQVPENHLLSFELTVDSCCEINKLQIRESWSS
jgi:hypothetical protein